MRFNNKLLGIGLVVLFSFGISQSAQAKNPKGQCLKFYNGVYAHAAGHKAFATTDGGAASARYGCGYSGRYNTKAEAIAEAQRRCKLAVVNGVRAKSCVIIDAK